jgi:hypothetical protein
MLQEAHRALRAAIRLRALIRIVFSILCLAAIAVYYYARRGQQFGNFGFGMIYTPLLVAMIGGLSVRALLANVRPFLTGATVGPVDPP